MGVFHLDAANKRKELPEFQDRLDCPHCGCETHTGFGLAGGGFGVYNYCDICEEVVAKTCEDEIQDE